MISCGSFVHMEVHVNSVNGHFRQQSICPGSDKGHSRLHYLCPGSDEGHSKLKLALSMLQKDKSNSMKSLLISINQQWQLYSRLKSDCENCNRMLEEISLAGAIQMCQYKSTSKLQNIPLVITFELKENKLLVYFTNKSRISFTEGFQLLVTLSSLYGGWQTAKSCVLNQSMSGQVSKVKFDLDLTVMKRAPINISTQLQLSQADRTLFVRLQTCIVDMLTFMLQSQQQPVAIKTNQTTGLHPVTMTTIHSTGLQTVAMTTNSLLTLKHLAHERRIFLLNEVLQKAHNMETSNTHTNSSNMLSSSNHSNMESSSNLNMRILAVYNGNSCPGEMRISLPESAISQVATVKGQFG